MHGPRSSRFAQAPAAPRQLQETSARNPGSRRPREDRPHAPAGRDAVTPAGIFRYVSQRTMRAAISRTPSRTCRSSRSGTAVGTGLNAPRNSATGSRPRSRASPAAPSSRANKFEALASHDAMVPPCAMKGLGLRFPRSPTTCGCWRAARAAGSASSRSRKTNGQLDHARQVNPRSARRSRCACR